ncbi:MAG: helix-turn-helix transcriptional regulator [Bacteroidota bacterium]
MSTVSDNIKYLRKKLGLTQLKFAELINIKRSSVGAYEEARATPPGSTLTAMATLFNVDTETLLTKDLSGNGLQSRQDFFSGSNQDNPDSFAKPGLPFNYDGLAKQVPGAYMPPDNDIDRLMPNRPINGAYSTGNGLNGNNMNGSSQTGNHDPRYANAQTGAQRQQQGQNLAGLSEEYLSGRGMRTLSVTVDHEQRPNIELVSFRDAGEYAVSHGDPAFLVPLPKFSLPILQQGNICRAFEIRDEGAGNITDGTIVVGTFLRNWYLLSPEKTYIVVTERNGIRCRQVINNINAKNSISLRSQNPNARQLNIPAAEVLEIWEAAAYLNTAPPRTGENIAHMQEMLYDMQQEITRLKKQQGA